MNDDAMPVKNTILYKSVKQRAMIGQANVTGAGSSRKS
jgi:hypothetical protein